jgi:predicted amidohydrolase
MGNFKIALCQMMVEENKKVNVNKAVQMIAESAKNGAQIVVLPEMFNCPYDNSLFEEYSENEKGQTNIEISKAARLNNVYVFAGSIPEIENGKIYNTSFAFNRQGEIIGKHRKMHLFDIDVFGKINFKESDTLTAGSSVTVVETEYCKVGLAVCYDMRFPELLRLMTLKGASLIIIPAAFNMTTGPAHWEPLIRVRALDNQVYMAVASPARDESASYTAYGHSMLVEPWGSIVKEGDEKEGIIYGDVDLDRISTVRNELPLLKHRRSDIYSLSENE